MNTYIALFRGINVGGKHILPMKDLVQLLEKLGCEQVKTYIQSGNVVFQHKEQQANTLGTEISSQILEGHGFEPNVLLLEAADLQEAVENNPFNTENGKDLHFYFLASHPENPDFEKLTAVQLPSEAFTLRHKVFYLYAPDGIGRSKLAAKVERCMGVPATARNWNTVRKLVSMVGQ